MEEKEKKKEIRENALQLFQQNGYDVVTIQDICKQSKISKHTFYYYFDSKEDLVLDLFHEPMKVGPEHFYRVMQEATALEQLMMVYRIVLGRYQSYGKEIVKKAITVNMSKAFDDEKKHHKENSYFKMLITLFEKAQKEKLVRQDLDIQQMMRASGVLFVGCLQIWATSKKDFNLEEMYMQHFKQYICHESL